MAKLVYHLMTDRELKKRVADAGLPTKGDRKVREQGKKTGSHAKVLVHSLKIFMSVFNIFRRWSGDIASLLSCTMLPVIHYTPNL